MRTMYVSPYRRVVRFHGASGRTPAVGSTSHEKVLAVDVRSDEDAYTISALLPGIEADGINVEILDKTVSIDGEFKGDDQDEGKCLVSELPTGRFSRVLTLPTALESSKAEAKLKNGVFTLRVPKIEEDRPRVIKINTN